MQQIAAPLVIVRESVAASKTAVLSGHEGCGSLESAMSLVSRRTFLAAVPAVAVGKTALHAASPLYLIVLTAKSKRCSRGQARVAHVTTDKAKAEKLAARLAKAFGARFVEVREGGVS